MDYKVALHGSVAQEEKGLTGIEGPRRETSPSHVGQGWTEPA